MATSYDRVSAHILDTEEGRFYMEQVRRRLATLRVSTCAFDVKEDPKNPRPYFRYRYDGATDEKGVWRNMRHEIKDFQVEWDYVMTEREITDLARNVWNQKKIPTYNCKLERAEKGPKGQNWLLHHFPGFCRDRVYEALREEHAAAGERIRGEIIAFYDSPEYEARKAQAIESSAVEEIKAALIRFRHLDDAVLRRAFMEFVAEDVLTC